MTTAERSVEIAGVAQRTRVRGGSWRQVLRRSLRQNPTIVVGGGLLLLLVLSAVLAPVLAPSNPIQTGFSTRVRPPAILGTPSGFVLGSDNLGRDILSRVLYGGQLSLSLSAASVVLSAVVGVAAGLLSG